MATSKVEGHMIKFSPIGSPSAIRPPSTPNGIFWFDNTHRHHRKKNTGCRESYNNDRYNYCKNSNIQISEQKNRSLKKSSKNR